VEATVSDTGSGVEPDILERLFEPFHTTKTQGLGLGLTISRSIVEDHEGRLWAMPNSPRGLTLLISLPLSEKFP
jgi:hypothetical protein